MTFDAIENPNALNTIPETVVRLRLSRASVYKLLKSGALPFVRLSGRTFVRSIDIDNLIAASIQGGVHGNR